VSLSVLSAATLALPLTLVTGVSGAPARASGTLQLNARFTVKWTAAFVCPPGLPATNSCYAYVGNAVVPGLGHVTERTARTFDGNREAPCVRTLPNAVIEVAGKGALELATTGPECAGIPPTRFSFDTTITGGSGKYAGVSGNVHVDSSVSGIPGIEGTGVNVWTGTLTVPGLDFDLTRPVIQGAVSKTVRAPKNAKRMRVRYTVTARDAVDGAVAASCTPRSGAFFKLGRTKVTCSATDSSGNTRHAGFVITVKRRA
jgi:hypothetical protein